MKLTSLWKTNWYNENWILTYSLFIRREKVSCQRTGSRDSWKMVRALLCTPQKICKWQLLCSCETFVRALLCTPQKICKWQLLCSCETFVRALLCTPQKICKWQLLCSCETFQLKSNRFQFMTMIHLSMWNETKWLAIPYMQVSFIRNCQWKSVLSLKGYFTFNLVWAMSEILTYSKLQ